MSAQTGATGAKAQLASYLRSFVDLGRNRLIAVGALVAVGTVVEGVGILLLIPLLGLIFPIALSAGGAATGHTSLMGTRVQEFLAQFTLTGQLIILLGTFVALLALRGLLGWRRDLEVIRLTYDLVDAWRARIVRAVAGASWQRLQKMQNSHLEFAVSSEVNRLSVGGDRLLRGGVSAVQLVLLLGIALFLSPWLTLLALTGGLLGVPLLLPLVRSSHRHGEELSRDGSERQNVLSEFLAGMKLAKVHDAERRYADDFIAVSDRMRHRALRFSDAQLRNHNAFQVAGGLAAALIALVGLVWLHTSPAVLSALLVLLTRIIGPVQQLAQTAQSILTMLPAVGSLTQIEASLSAEPEQVVPAKVDAVQAGPLAVALTGISYRLPGRDQPLFQGLDCSIAPGELAVLLGASGSGKTTLADILLGLIAPENGTIKLGGLPIRNGADRVLARRHIAYVQQESFLFDESLRQNLLWAEPGASEEQLWEALTQAEAADFVRRLPDGLETIAGNRGSRFSGGERQRICLARALLRRPGLLILDEATSALDRAVEDRLLQTFMRLRGKMTLLIIAHRLPEWFAADITFTLENGALQAPTRQCDERASG